MSDMFFMKKSANKVNSGIWILLKDSSIEESIISNQWFENIASNISKCIPL